MVIAKERFIKTKAALSEVHKGLKIGNASEDKKYDYVIYDSIFFIKKSLWESIREKDKSFMAYDLLVATEMAGPDGMSFKYIVIYENDFPIGISIFQIVLLNKSSIKAMAKMRLNFKGDFESKNSEPFYAIVCGNTLFSGESAFSYASTADFCIMIKTINSALREVKYKLKNDKKILFTSFKDFTDNSIIKNSFTNSVLERKRYSKLMLEPNLIINVVWDSFEEYIDSMKPKYKRRAKSVFKKGDVLVRKELSYEDIRNYNDRLYELYSQVLTRSGSQFYKHNTGYLLSMKENMKYSFSVVGYFYQNELVAFTTYVLGKSEMAGFLHGIDYRYNKKFDIYQNILYDDVRLAIAKRYKKISLGRTSIEMKSSIGAVPEEMYVYVKVSSHFTNHLVKIYSKINKKRDRAFRNPFIGEEKV